MALVQKTKKVTHCLAATKQYMHRFFATLTHMYETGLQTDLVLVASDGTSFSIHKIMLIACSSFVREMLPKELNCECEIFSIFLPDYKPRTIKNLLSILYTGRSLGDCSTKDLKSLIDTLQIDIKNLQTSTLEEAKTASASTLKYNEEFFETDEGTSEEHNDAETPSPTDGAQEEEDDDEMLEVTPEVQMFFGNHFMAGGDEEEEDPHAELRRRIQAAVGEEAVKQRHHHDHERHNGGDMNGDTVIPMPTKGYLCRLCGHSAPNGASLFAHLLYPHYAHLWRTEIPHRANKYDCRQCPYSTTKRQHFVMHVARVHDDLKKKMEALGENLEILDNLSPKTQSTNTELIPSVIAKQRIADDFLADESNQSPFTREEALDSPHSKSNYSPSTKDMLAQKELLGDFSPSKAAAVAAAFSSSQAMVAAATAAALNDPFGLIQNRFPRGFKPWVKCRLCGKGWKGKDNFFTHLVSTHFKYLWAAEVPKHADMFQCHVGSCNYQSKYRYNFLFHLAGKHKQLKQKLASEGIPLDVLVPVETDGSEFDPATALATPGGANGSGATNALMEALKRSKQLLLQHQQRRGVSDSIMNPSLMKLSGLGGGGRGKPQSPTTSTSNTRLVCRVCHKVSLNHTCHRQHVVGKHFQEFWSHHSPDHMGIFHCHHSTCTYKTPNRSVFVIHLAYVHSELKTKLIESGQDPNCATPDVYGKRKYRREPYESGSQPPHLPNLNSSTSSNIDHSDAGTSSGTAGPGTHNKSGSGDDDSRGVKYRCKLCQAESSQYRVLTEHLAVYHFGHIWDDPAETNPFAVPESGPFNCQICSGFSTSSRQSFICHSVSQHDILKQVMSHHYDDKTIDDLIDVIGDENGDLSDMKVDEEEAEEGDDYDEEDYVEASDNSSAW